jgi:large subunit ribosomal protein L1
MPARSKRYQNDAKKASQDPVSVTEGVKKVRTYASTKFDQSVDIVMHLGIDTKQSDQNLRGALSLPHGIGKSRKVIAFCEDSDAEAAKAAGRSGGLR